MPVGMHRKLFLLIEIFWNHRWHLVLGLIFLKHRFGNRWITRTRCIRDLSTESAHTWQMDMMLHFLGIEASNMFLKNQLALILALRLWLVRDKVLTMHQIALR